MKIKKIFGLLLAGAIALSAVAGLAACGDDENKNPNPDNTGNTDNTDTDAPEKGTGVYSTDHTGSSTVGWYVLGTGAGSLDGVEWDNFEAAMMLKDDGNGYLSITLDLFNGDYFKILYNHAGTAAQGFSGDEEWNTYSIGYIGSDNTAGNEMVGFTFDGDGNAVVMDGYSGSYTIKIVSTATTKPEAVDVEGGITLTRDLALKDKEIASDFYIVGLNSKWPSNSTEADWIPLTGSNGVYTATLDLKASDEFKIYNASSKKYNTLGYNLNELANIKGYEGKYTITVETSGEGAAMTVEVSIEKA